MLPEELININPTFIFTYSQTGPTDSSLTSIFLRKKVNYIKIQVSVNGKSRASPRAPLALSCLCFICTKTTPYAVPLVVSINNLFRLDECTTSCDRESYGVADTLSISIQS